MSLQKIKNTRFVQMGFVAILQIYITTPVFHSEISQSYTQLLSISFRLRNAAGLHILQQCELS